MSETVPTLPKLRAPRVKKLPTPKQPAPINPIIIEAIQRVAARKAADLPRVDPVEWIEREFYIPETRKAMTLAPYQARALREALSRDERGLFKYSTIVWSDIKKSAKTSIGAAVADWLLANMSFTSVKFIANDLKQADSRAGRMLATNFKLHPRDGVKSTPSGYKIEYPNSSLSESIAIDPSGEAGGNDNIVEFDELWGAHEKAKETMWTEMTNSPTKFGKSFRWVSSYAGYLGESELLWNLYLLGVDENAQFPGKGVRFDWCDEFDPPLECYHNDAARLFCLWNTSPRLDWQTQEYYQAESSILIPAEFNRIHRNQWSSAIETFVPIEWWDACKGELPAIDKDEYLIGGIDAAVSSDCFGIVLVSRKGDDLFVRYARQWSPPQGGKIRFSNEENPDDTAYPEGELRRLSSTYNILEWAYDPAHLSEMPDRLQRAGFGFYKKFLQGKPRVVADKGLYDLIAKKAIHHSGEPDLRSHIMNSNVEVHGERDMRIVKRAPTLHVDLTVALSMAANRALHYRLG